jgi:SHS2 domain-containing protein
MSEVIEESGVPPSGSFPGRWHRWVDHTSEVQLQVGAESLAGLAAEAGKALAIFLLRGAPAEPSGPPRVLEVSSTDREALLVDWLNEILYVAETGLWIPLELDILESSPNHLRASCRGATVEEPPSTVKAATFHGLQVTEGEGGLQAEVIFDV